MEYRPRCSSYWKGSFRVILDFGRQLYLYMPCYRSYGNNKIKRNFFRVLVLLVLQYGCTTCTLTKRFEKSLHGNYTITLHDVLNKSWRQYPTKQQLYGHLTNYLSKINKTFGAQLKKQGRTHKWRSSMDPYTWTC